MPTSRRRTILGLGGLLAACGAVVGTGVFDTVEAQRDVTVETAGDADAFLGLVPARGELIDVGGEDLAVENDGLLEIAIGAGDNEGLNQNARTVFNHLVLVQNNGTRTASVYILLVGRFGTDSFDHCAYGRSPRSTYK